MKKHHLSWLFENSNLMIVILTLLIIITSGVNNKAGAQVSTPFDTIALEIRHLYGPLIPLIDSPFFYDLAPTISDTSFHNPIKPDTLNVTTEAWVRTYNQFRYAAIDNSWLPPFDTLYNRWLQESPDTIPLLALCFTYKRIKPSVFELDVNDSPFKFDSLTEQFSLKPGLNIGNYLEQKTFLLVAPSTPEVQFLNKVYKFDPNYFFADEKSQDILNSYGLTLKWSKNDSLVITNFNQTRYFYDTSNNLRSVDTIFAFIQKTGSPVLSNSYSYLTPVNLPTNTSFYPPNPIILGIPNSENYDFDYMRVTKFNSCNNSNYKKALFI